MAKSKDSLGRQVADTLVYQSKRIGELSDYASEADDIQELEESIDDTDLFLAKYGIVIQDDDEEEEETSSGELIVVPSWGELVSEARAVVGSGHMLDELFTPEELAEQDASLSIINDDFKAIHHLDKYDVGICALAGIVSAAVDILLVGIPERSPEGLKAARLEDWIREGFNKKFPEAEMAELAKLAEAKVPYDAPFNPGFTEIEVEGLSAYYHRLLSLGHDPLLGLVVGVHDIMTGKMTTVDKAGHVVSQVMDRYADRTEKDIFEALAKQILHFKTDVTTTMGLPAPGMAIFNLFQFGDIGEEELTVAEIVQGMYYEGYDFIHFCSQSIPVMITELIVRLGYAAKRIRGGNALKDSIPFSTSHAKNPKLGSMLFIAHSAATAINAGRVYFKKNPMAINYPQWFAFAIYSFKQAKWVFIDKPEARHAYVDERLDSELAQALQAINESIARLEDGNEIVFA